MGPSINLIHCAGFVRVRPSSLVTDHARNIITIKGNNCFVHLLTPNIQKRFELTSSDSLVSVLMQILQIKIIIKKEAQWAMTLNNQNDE